ncbi:ParB N-terminal domain-containing protein [Variovorax ureilyticus]|uniref:ParB N-terminal domain-containing protein n=1 Tax=Variovorax ureilyticus TaxID=1836198 RepID=A0ABU8VEU9_9BURK
MCTGRSGSGKSPPIVVVEKLVADRGIITPGYLLVAGCHRVEAARAIGWKEINARIIKASSLERELIEIDENLCRAELTAARAAHMKRRAQIWEALGPAKRQVATDVAAQPAVPFEVAQVEPPAHASEAMAMAMMAGLQAQRNIFLLIANLIASRPSTSDRVTRPLL